MFKQSEQTKQIHKTFFATAILHPLFKHRFSNLRQLLSITFPPRIPKVKKKFGHWTLGNRAKRPLNGVRKCDRQTNTPTHISTYRKNQPRGPILCKEILKPVFFLDLSTYKRFGQ